MGIRLLIFITGAATSTVATNQATPHTGKEKIDIYIY